MLTSFEIGTKIAQARKAKNLSQAQLADLMAISSQAVSKWERGESMPDIISFGRLAELLEVDLNYFSDFPSGKNHPSEKGKDSESAEPEPLLWDMSSFNWEDSDFSGLSGLQDRFSSSNIVNCLFVGSDLSNLTLKSNNVLESDFSQASLRNSRIATSRLEKNVFTQTDLSGAHIAASYISRCDFAEANLTGLKMDKSNFSENKVEGVIFERCDFKRSSFSKIAFEGKISNCSFVECGFKKVEFHNVTFIKTLFKTRKLKGTSFIDCKADNITFAFLKNCKADLSGITLIED